MKEKVPGAMTQSRSKMRQQEGGCRIVAWTEFWGHTRDIPTDPSCSPKSGQVAPGAPQGSHIWLSTVTTKTLLVEKVHIGNK